MLKVTEQIKDFAENVWRYKRKYLSLQAQINKCYMDMNMNETNERVGVSEDALLRCLEKYGVKLIRLSELTGIREAAVNSCFHHHKNNRGVPRHFNREQVALINDALPRLAGHLRALSLRFDRERAEVNSRGTQYDRGLVEPMKQIGEWLNLTALCERALGWKKKKKESILVSRVSGVYGNITEADAAAVNAELLAVAGVLEGQRLTAWGQDGDGDGE